MLRCIFLRLLLLLAGCAGGPGAYCPPGSAARVVVARGTGAECPPLTAPPHRAVPLAISALPEAPARVQRRGTQPVAVTRGVGRQLRRRARAVATARAASAAHAPTSHMGDGLWVLLWLALGLLALIILVVVLAAVLPGVTLGVVGAWVLFGLLAAGALWLGYAAFG